MVLEDKDKDKIWYRGIGNLTSEECDIRWKKMLKDHIRTMIIIVIYSIILIVVGYFPEMSFESAEWHIIVGVALGMDLTAFSFIFVFLSWYKKWYELRKGELEGNQ